MAEQAKEISLLGWKEKVAFPGWGLTLRALMDPAGPLSTLLVARVESLGPMKDAEGRRRNVLRLAVPMAQGRERLKIVHAYQHRRTRLGEGLGRCLVIRVPLRIGELAWEGEIALVRGPRRQYFLHLGRADLAGRFHVDPARSYTRRLGRVPFEPEPSLPLPELRGR